MPRSWLWVEEGNICTSGELRKGKSHPSRLYVWCQLGVTCIICLGAFFVCLFGGGGISTILHSCFVESIAWIMLDAKAAAVTLTTFFEILSLPIWFL